VLLAALAATVGSLALAVPTLASWTAYPGQADVYSTQVQQPINASSTSRSVFNAKRGVIPVKLALSAGQGPLMFQSVFSDTLTTNDYSFISWTPGTALTLDTLTELRATYAFTSGNCHGGSLRWSVAVDMNDNGDASDDPRLAIYYGEHPNFADCTTSTPDADDGSGDNLVGSDELRYDTSQFSGGTFYDSWEHAKELAGTHAVLRASLVVDSGWGGDQVVSLSGASANGETFSPLPEVASAPTCALPAAGIRVTKTDATASGLVNEPTTVQPNDTNGAFRIVDCKYMYNLDVSSLRGAGTYKVEAVIGGQTAGGAAYFDLK
jgi:hypothetical protein